MAVTGTQPTSPRTLERAYWEADRGMSLVDVTVGELLADRARAHPDRIALIGVRHGTHETVRLTYADLLDEACRVAVALSQLAERGTHVALWAPNVIEWPVVQYGAALAGVVLVALNPALREEELEYALSHSGASILLHADVSRDYRMSEVAANLSRALPGLRCVSLSDTSTWRAVDGDLSSCASPDADEVAMLQYTSGTTGRPKGVLLKHRSLVNVAKLTLESVNAPPGAVCLNPLPLFHTAGCVIATLGPLWLAGTVVLVDRFVPGPVLKSLRDENVSVLFYVPTVLGALLECQRAGHEPAPRLHTVMGGASNVPAAMIVDAEQIFGATVINLFGQTELSPVLSTTRPGDSRHDQLTTVGRPLPQVDCKIVDPGTNQTVAVGQQGEICARGYQQFLGYLHDPEATLRAVDEDGFVHTGDLGTMDSRGYLTVTGRLKELIIRGGENIAPAEIESVVVEHESIVEVAVFGLPDERLGEVVVAVILLRGESAPDLKQRLVDHTRARLARFKVPSRWFVASRLPVTQTGKVRKFELREAILADELPEL
ncbi:class I adenylate-forming enzyme family protein [Mycobacterium talmoniae]|uniref:3-[(3aS,4S,7aS)-7a-methyl-1, 5-dioxo-octahydro-1H-inden-4-yl]propanoyl:CoA ligase n=1 Tax=Mycobacterium talmoniae TaxID=1858794 RepID=A0A1S1NMI7_9MYCO|nr:long-chain fatty acid--CoA ligase [Mycobacterium talmoniae]PQM45402.1 3-[(3aS,4S,7aS)-7a-methyl-1,5-dioxo-octahydro-1H-inden-4-yl]propanoyl:CoA ligase [Mycobacterium talmoniae]TDH49338.1 long-chain fatty acid--CoA ligase [Mycobacterium eburneum]